MKNIHTLLEEIGFTVPDEKKADFDKAVAANYRTIAEVEKATAARDTYKSQLESANKQIGELSESVKALEGSNDTLKELQDKVAAYEKAEIERKAAEQRAAEDAALKAAYDVAVEGKAFVNDFTKSAIFDACKAELAKIENKGKGIAEIFTALTTDKAGIFANSNPALNYGPAQNLGDGGEMTKEAFDKLTLGEQFQFAKNNPADYERLTKI